MGAVASENPDSAKEDKSKLVANKGAQFTSYDVNAFEVPSGRDELWRFTPLRRLRGLHDGSAVADGTAQVTVGAADQVVVETVGRDDDRLGKAGVPADRIAAQAYSAFTEATIVSVPNEVEVAEPIEITIDGPGVDHVAYGHVQIRLGTFARATVVIDQRGSGTYAENVEFVLGDSSQLHVVLIQDWQSDAVHVAAHHALLGRDSVLRHYNVSLGGDLVRISPTVRYSAPGGDANMLGVYFADAGQHLEQRLLVDHSAPHCKSNVMYKGALQGETGPGTVDAHTVWIGDVLIRAEAEGTETYELNRNLVLTDGARADSVPNLEIETGEIVGAGHASATGRFDDEQLFYLRARGISEEVARRLVVRGFFHEIIDKIPVPAVRERLDAAIETELAVVGA
ncbi:Fe-S cluster assembly protein SufD [Rhodococcus fascians]|jgi:Fe-S cluster assembly protein SufD|uniref:Fe-S cluster assembly protein SufD n=1 Tax=Nocardiaceae TaxID=85025 RepID=UPI000B9B09E3|nr:MULTISPECIES: Fe-S cluster assembly protein SufD [Rhodococcus]MBJ7325163.1 Fe-S cluster assembly protein SufD [Rhodococcus sp. (in: high G+C Gram-positive bacteria)]MBY4038613.1 Fe-S cluster assembly protein SufD [Rhodococcus fascians]MBY4140629.1 Fe-S cluster assembly protein SufD [Rhodococcus fascians]MBY4211143.1 Fe-S cluster assembly protein SufD [Rhodococcus fascians]MBY4219294.1 Fe-S cluster assembly protein SufD [Rhodococcus fascians]